MNISHRAWALILSVCVLTSPTASIDVGSKSFFSFHTLSRKPMNNKATAGLGIVNRAKPLTHITTALALWLAPPLYAELNVSGERLVFFDPKPRTPRLTSKQAKKRKPETSQGDHSDLDKKANAFLERNALLFQHHPALLLSCMLHWERDPFALDKNILWRATYFPFDVNHSAQFEAIIKQLGEGKKLIKEPLFLHIHLSCRPGRRVFEVAWAKLMERYGLTMTFSFDQERTNEVNTKDLLRQHHIRIQPRQSNTAMTVSFSRDYRFPNDTFTYLIDVSDGPPHFFGLENMAHLTTWGLNPMFVFAHGFKNKGKLLPQFQPDSGPTTRVQGDFLVHLSWISSATIYDPGDSAIDPAQRLDYRQMAKNIRRDLSSAGVFSKKPFIKYSQQDLFSLLEKWVVSHWSDLVLQSGQSLPTIEPGKRQRVAIEMMPFKSGLFEYIVPMRVKLGDGTSFSWVAHLPTDSFAATYVGQEFENQKHLHDIDPTRMPKPIASAQLDPSGKSIPVYFNEWVANAYEISSNHDQHPTGLILWTDPLSEARFTRVTSGDTVGILREIYSLLAYFNELDLDMVIPGAGDFVLAEGIPRLMSARRLSQRKSHFWMEGGIWKIDEAFLDFIAQLLSVHFDDGPATSQGMHDQWFMHPDYPYMFFVGPKIILESLYNGFSRRSQTMGITNESVIHHAFRAILEQFQENIDRLEKRHPFVSFWLDPIHGDNSLRAAIKHVQQIAMSRTQGAPPNIVIEWVSPETGPHIPPWHFAARAA